MSLDIHFFKKDVDFNQIRNDIDDLTNKRQAIDEELERLEDDYEDAKLTSLNVTHNLNKMAEVVGLYKILWYPEEVGITSASQMIEPLEKAIKELEANPEKYKAYNPPNGWGDYGIFVSFCRSMLSTCRENPDAVIEAAG
jgi:DNA repair exonuclease SbcCD ATPase subunit